jgi:Thymidylate synthase
MRSRRIGRHGATVDNVNDQRDHLHRAGLPRPGPAARGPGDAPITRTINAATLGEAWLATAELILREGRPARWGTEPTREVALVTIAVGDPDPDDPLIGRLGDPAWLAWMRANFREPGAVAELGGADSYARRLRDYAGTGRDQVAWLAARLAADPDARDATITTFQPTTDTTYIPCISIIDAWAPDGRLELVVYAHSLDLGKKAYANFVELAALQREIAAGAGLPTGGLVVHVKTAHIYEPELGAMARLVGETAVGRG